MSTPGLRANGLVLGLHDTSVYVSEYGAVGDGVTDDTAAIQAAITAAGAGVVYFPAGNYYVTDTLTIATNYVHIRTAGLYATRFVFGPSSAKSLFKFTAGASEIAGCSIGGLVIDGKTGNTQTKTGIEIVDGSGFHVYDVWIDPGQAGNFKNSSIGIHLRGKELTTIERIRITADIPVLLDVDPNSASVGCDHIHISDTFLEPTRGTSGACLTIANGVPVSNLTIDGYNGWIVGKYGLYWNDTTSPTVHFNVRLQGIRCEQADDTTGFSFYVNTTVGIQNVQFVDDYMASATSGIHINNTTELLISTSVFGTNNAALKHLDISGGVADLFITGCYWQINTLATTTGLTLVTAAPQILNASALPPTAWYSDSTTASAQYQWITTAIKALGNILKNNSTANTNPWKLDTVNSYSAGNELLGIYNAGTLALKFNGDGSIVSNAGKLDCFGATPLYLGHNTASSVQPGSPTAPVICNGALRPTTDAIATQTGSVYMGSGAPSNANGNNGDVYFRTDTPGTVNQRIYVKSAGSWTGIL